MNFIEADSFEDRFFAVQLSLENDEPFEEWIRKNLTEIGSEI